MEHCTTFDRDSFATVLTPASELCSSQVPALQQELRSGIKDAGDTILLDLRGHDHIDSMGLSLVVGMYQDCTRSDKKFSVVIDHAFIAKVVQTMHLDKHITFLLLERDEG